MALFAEEEEVGDLFLFLLGEGEGEGDVVWLFEGTACKYTGE